MAELTFADFAKKMQALGPALPAAMREGTKKATEILHARSKQIMNERIYSIPEDRAQRSFNKQGVLKSQKLSTGEVGLRTGAGMGTGERAGNKKWRRTGKLRNSETQKLLSNTEGLVQNDAGYALPRHDLGLPAGSPEAINGSKRKSTRIAPFRKRAIHETAQARLKAYHDALWRPLSK